MVSTNYRHSNGVPLIHPEFFHFKQYRRTKWRTLNAGSVCDANRFLHSSYVSSSAIAQI